MSNLSFYFINDEYLEHRPVMYFITESYSKNKTFFYNELKSLVARYKVIIISANGPEEVNDLPGDAKIHFYKNELSKLKKCGYFFRYLFNQVCQEEYRRNVIKAGFLSKKYFERLIKSVEFYGASEEFYKFFDSKVRIKDVDQAIYYTYWSNYYTLAMALHKDAAGNQGITMFTRLHGFDLYDERFSGGVQPFKTNINKAVKRLFFVSQLSMNYYKERHGLEQSDKLRLSRLGTKKIEKAVDTAVAADKTKDKICYLYSCSNVIPLKRVDYIIKALSKSNDRIHWTHIGDGKEFTKIKELAAKELDLNTNISYEFKGRLSNEEVRELYKNNQMDIFINTSETEGCPVSIMEAMSVGAMIIGTAVGEVPVMIDGNGVLLKTNPDIEEITNAFHILINSEPEEKEKMSNRSKQLWSEMFNADKNISDFLKEIADIGE